jgi:LmbE family N-acetylglucosaminyl deacetylase
MISAWKNVLIVAPHADDETLGAGGTILRLRASGARVTWLLLTQVTAEHFGQTFAERRRREVDAVNEAYGFDRAVELPFAGGHLHQADLSDLLARVSSVVTEVRPDAVLTAYPGDAHSEHLLGFKAVCAATKTFRFPFVRHVGCYETLSETDFALDPDSPGFRPNLLVDISEHLERKIEIMKLYESELGEHPFPRSAESIRALARLRGSARQCAAAEAFSMLKILA